MNPLRRALWLAVLASSLVSLALAAPAQRSAVSGKSARGLSASPAAIAWSLQLHINALAPTSQSPQLTAEKLSERMARPGVPEDVIAAQYLILSLRSPQALKVVQDFLKNPKLVSGGSALAGNLAAIAQPYVQSEALRQTFGQTIAPLQEQFARQGAPINAAALKQSLDSMFENANGKAAGDPSITSTPAVDAREPAQGSGKIKRPLAKATARDDKGSNVPAVERMGTGLAAFASSSHDAAASAAEDTLGAAARNLAIVRNARPKDQPGDSFGPSVTPKQPLGLTPSAQNLLDLAPSLNPEGTLDAAAATALRGAPSLVLATAEKVKQRQEKTAADGRVDKLLQGPLETPELQPDFVNMGMGPTGMMAMVAAIASGHTAAGVELRGPPTRGVHQNIREEWYHVLGLLDTMMLKRYGEAGIPKLPNGKPFMLADFFYNAERAGGALDFQEIFGVGKEQNQNVAGRLTRISFEDARDATREANGGKARVYTLPPPAIPNKPDPAKVTGNMAQVLDSPSTFQVALINYELMLRAYLEAMEKQDKENGRAPRVKLYQNHRVVQDGGDAIGYVDADLKDNRRIIIEEVQDQRGDNGGPAARARKAGTKPIDLGVPTRFTLSTGFGGGVDGKTLGYKQEDVAYTDPATGQKIAARQNWIVGEVTANIGGQLLRRISTITDPKTGIKHTVRQIAVGHENAPNVAWVPVQVPDFMTFDPVEAGILPQGSDPNAPEFAEAARKLVRDYFISQVSAVTHIPEADIRRMRMFYGPNFFTLRERIGTTAHVAANGNVAGDLMGNGHFLTSGGSMTGMIGHTVCFLRYWDNINRGVPPDLAARVLEDGIKSNSEAWLHVSAKEFDGLSPANFGEERAKAIGITADNSNPTNASTNAQNFGLSQVLGQQNWQQAFQRLLSGVFGRAGEDFYVPKREVDVTVSPDVVVQQIRLTQPGQ